MAGWAMRDTFVLMPYALVADLFAVLRMVETEGTRESAL